MSLFRASLWSLLVVGVDLMVGLINQKVYAHYTGHAGIVLAGNFQNVSNLLILLGSGGILGGITKVVAERGSRTTWPDIVRLLAVLSTIVALGSLLGSDLLTRLITPPGAALRPEVVQGFLLSLPLIVLTNAYLHRLMGEKQLQRYSLLRIVLQGLNLLFTLGLTAYLLLNGVVLSGYVHFLFLFALIVFFVEGPRRLLLPLREWSRIRFQQAKGLYQHLFKFSVATIVALVLLYISQLVIRNYVSYRLSVQEAAYWQVLATLSRVWLAFFSFVIVSYFFPHIASLSDRTDVKKAVLRTGTLLGLGALIGSVLIFLLRKPLLLLIYNPSFLGAERYFAYQLAADVLKVGVILFGYFALAKNFFRPYIIFEIAYYIIWLGIAWWAVPTYGLRVVFIGQIIASLVYLSGLVGVFAHWTRQAAQY